MILTRYSPQVHTELVAALHQKASNHYVSTEIAREMPDTNCH